MNHRLLVLLMLIGGLMCAQQKGNKKTQDSSRTVIDSIAALQWNKNTVNIDSIRDVKLVRIPRSKVDTIILRPVVRIPEAQDVNPVTPYQVMNAPAEQVWYFTGQNSLLFNQASFSNWNAGGSNNLGFNGRVNYNLIFRKRRSFVDNNIELRYGIVTTKGQSTRKTDDYLKLFSNYGYDLRNNYYLSAGVQFLSQFSPGYDYNATPNPTRANRISSFMAPGYLDVGVGIAYNPKENLQIIFRPVTGRFTFVLDPALQKAGTYGLKRDGQSVRSEFGALANIIYRIEFMKDFTLTNQLNLFSSYSDHPERVAVYYTGALAIKFNKRITTNLTLDLLYDHDQLKKLQVKQTLGVGFAYDFGVKSKKTPNAKQLVNPFGSGLGN